MELDDYIDMKEAMREGGDQCGLSLEDQYKKVIQALVRQAGNKCVITPHDFAEPNFLSCRLDEFGNIILSAPKTSVFGIPEE